MDSDDGERSGKSFISENIQNIRKIILDGRKAKLQEERTTLTISKGTIDCFFPKGYRSYL